MNLKSLEMRQDIKILSMFLIVQFLGLLLATQIYTGATIVQLNSNQISSSASFAVYYVAGIIVFTMVLLLIIKWSRSDLFFRVLEAIAVFATSFIVFLVIIGVLTNSLNQLIFGTSVLNYQYVTAILMAIALVAAKNKWPRLRNTASILASVGIGLVVGLDLPFFVVFIFMIILAVYDFIAVFITKHMVTMGTAMANMNLAFLVGASDAEAVPEGSLSKEEVKRFEKNRHLLSRYGTDLEKNLGKQKLVPIIGRRELGNGDLAVPLMAAVSAYKVFQNFVFSFVIVFGAVAGLLITFFILSKYRRALPAIPPLLFGITVASAIYLLLIGAVAI